MMSNNAPGGVDFPESYFDKFIELVFSGELESELQHAYEYLSSLPPMVPAGIASAIRTFDPVRQLITEHGDGITFSGTLTQLILDSRAVNTIDTGMIGYIIEYASTDSFLKKLIGTIIVNIDEGLHNGKAYYRVDSDAEVDALCLLMYWTRGCKASEERMISLASDLVFEGRRMGRGSKFFGARLELMNTAEKRRFTWGVSAWRKCIFLCDYLDRITAECQLSTSRSQGERLMKAIGEDCTTNDDWSADTLNRYLQVGRRVAATKVRKWLSIWETVLKRDSLLDGIQMLRSCIGVTKDDEDLAWLIHLLFLEQRSGLKKSLSRNSSMSPASLFKPYLLRESIFERLRN